jgi:hypothetical protein
MVQSHPARFFARLISAQNVSAEMDPAFAESLCLVGVQENASVSARRRGRGGAIDNRSRCD